MSSQPCIITVAITGSVPRKEDNPAVPITIAEQIESTHAAFEAGATIAHVHVRNDDQTPTSDPERFARLQEGLRKHCPGMIIQFSTGGRSGKGSERGGMLHLRPDMASLATGSCNFPMRIYENHPDLIRELARAMLQYGVKPEIEVFDVSMLYQAINLVDEGLIEPPLHVQFVFGIKHAMPAVRQVLEFEVSELGRLMPEATWTAAGIGRHQLEVNHWALELGGHCRTGLEDNVRWDKGRMAASNGELVARVAGLCAEYGRRPATVAEARAMLRLPAAAPVAA
jgi:3-keto-5-aminohexanoate cleavage enzyme